MLSVAIASYSQQESITVIKKQPVRELRGAVFIEVNHQPLEDVEVDVFDVNQNLVASTKTASDGTFRLKHLPDGKYNLRFRAMGFNEMHDYVAVKSHSFGHKKLVVRLPVAT